MLAPMQTATCPQWICSQQTLTTNLLYFLIAFQFVICIAPDTTAMIEAVTFASNVRTPAFDYVPLLGWLVCNHGVPPHVIVVIWLLVIDIPNALDLTATLFRGIKRPSNWCLLLLGVCIVRGRPPHSPWSSKGIFSSYRACLLRLGIHQP